MGNKVALVTGATGGIGSAVTQELCLAGWQVIAQGHTPERLDLLREGDPRRVFPWRFDVAAPQSAWFTELLNVFDWYDLPHRLDALVCCHGHPPRLKPSLEVSVPQDFMPLLVVDLFGAFSAAQTAAPLMIRAGGGAIVFVSSLHARQTYPARVAYSSAKAAVAAMARSLALEWGAQGVRVNTVLPWQVAGARTESLAATPEGADLLALYAAKSPQRRLVTEEEVADAVMFALGNTALNGAEIVLDGGVSASMWYRPFTDYAGGTL